MMQHKYRLPLGVIGITAGVAILVKLFVGCTPEYKVTVPVEKNAVRVDPPELNVDLPIYVVTEHCDGGFTVVRLNPDAGAI